MQWEIKEDEVGIVSLRPLAILLPRANQRHVEDIADNWPWLGSRRQRELNPTQFQIYNTESGESNEEGDFVHDGATSLSASATDASRDVTV